jgi:hypothetical protein
MRVDAFLILGAIGIWMLSVVTAALSRLLAYECKAWVPWLTKWIIRRATAGLPEDQRERYKEEWTSHIGETPGDIGKIVTALDFVRAAKRVSTETAKKGPIIIKLHGIPAPAVVNAVCRIEARGGFRVTGVVTPRLVRES